ncbi:MAG: murein transglycosylase, partial [Nostocales cyanobacterium]
MMKKTLALFSLGLGIALMNPVTSVIAQVTIPQPVPIPVPSTEPATPEAVPALQPISPEVACNQQRCIGWDEQLWGSNGDRQALLTSIDHSLRYLETNR